MATNKVQLQSQGIKRALRNYKIYDSIAEYIWNGFDAQATKVVVSFAKNELGGIEYITVKDNGYGISEDTLKIKFTPVFESEKTIIKANKNNTSTYHGKNGVGRLTFFNFATDAQWNTVYQEEDKYFAYSITINASTLEDFSNTEKEETTEPTGTEVLFSNIDSKFSVDELINYLQIEFAWYIELKNQQGCELIIDNQPFDNSGILADRTVHTFEHEASASQFDVVFCRWNRKLNDEFSKYYYLDSCGIEKYKENTTLNNKGDKFFHSVYIKSSIFNEFTFENSDNQLVFDGFTKDSDEFKFIKEQVDKLLRDKRNPFIKEYTKSYLGELKKNGAYPQYNNSFFDVYRKDVLDALISNIYYAEPKIFAKLNQTQQKTFIRLFDLIIQTDELNNLFNIIEGVIDMTDDERKELADVLEYTSLSNITKTITLLKDRAKAVEYLKRLVFDKDLYVTEIDHIQPFIETHYWLFGEQYHLVTAEEPDFEEALRRFLYVLRGEKNLKGTVKLDHPDKQKEMDIFAVQQRKNGDIKKCIVVELKRPSVTLKNKELTQVKKYFETIQSDARFNANNIEWEFYLIGNKINTEIEHELENSKHHGERSLAYKVNKCKIYVKTWSDIITEFEINNDFLLNKLQFQQEQLINTKKLSADEIIQEQENNNAAMPSEIIA